MRRVLAVAAGMLLVLGIGAALTSRAHPANILRTGPAAAPRPTTTTPTTGVAAKPAPGQSLVSGTVTSLTADNANAAALKAPLTITVAAPGTGGADIRGVEVGGRTVAISWGGGRPLPLTSPTGNGSLNLTGAPVTIDASGITWSLDGAPRSLTPGRYLVETPVAVGTSGLAQPRQSVTFNAGAGATLDTHGSAIVHLPPTAIHLDGPGRHLTLHGTFQVRTPHHNRTATSITFGPGSYSIDLTPVAGGYAVKAVLQGPTKIG
jgi:hypothetical protein